MGGELLKTIFLFALLIVLFFGSIVYLVNTNSINPFMMPSSVFVDLGGLRIASSAFPPNGQIPPKYTCQGPNVNPPIAISGVSDQAKSLVVILYESDRRNGNTYNWIVVNINPTITEIKENSIPEGGIHLVNDYGSATYVGPCPTEEGKHDYVYKIYALPKIIEKNQFKSVTELMEYLNKNNLGYGTYTGKYKLL